MEKTFPKWWTRVIKDIEKIEKASTRAFFMPNIVIGKTVNDDGYVTGYVVRMSDGEAGYYPVSSLKIKKEIPIGVKITSGLENPEFLVKDPALKSFIAGTIRDQVALIPPLWLNRFLDEMSNPKEMRDYNKHFKPFEKWVKLPKKVKENPKVIQVLLKAIDFEGIKGLVRFNDLDR